MDYKESFEQIKIAGGLAADGFRRSNFKYVKPGMLPQMN